MSKLPENTTPVNSKDLAAARCKGRMAVVTDTRLSDGAVRLYLILDDAAGWKGRAWSYSTALAKMLGITRAEVFKRLAELERFGYIKRIRGQYKSEIVLAWSLEVSNWRLVDSAESREVSKRRLVDREKSPNGEPEVSKWRQNADLSLYEPVLEPVQQQQSGTPRKKPVVVAVDSACTDILDGIARLINGA
jgi:DNA-binding Lrp family transcriptional regulator